MQYSRAKRRQMVDRSSTLSIVRQCALLSIDRSGWYYQAIGPSELHVQLVKLVKRYYILYPFFGARRMLRWILAKHPEFKQLNIKRIFRIYQLLHIRALYPKIKTTRRSQNPDNQIFPYLLRRLSIETPNHVWATDITYISVLGGGFYLCAIIDIYSRFVVGFHLSNSMHVDLCLEALYKAVEHYGCPQILNTDQGSQFTSREYTNAVRRFSIR